MGSLKMRFQIWTKMYKGERKMSQLVSDAQIKLDAMEYREKAKNIMLMPLAWVTGIPAERAIEYNEIAEYFENLLR